MAPGSTSSSSSLKHQTRNASLQEKDRCLVYHGEQLYEARVVKVEHDSSSEGRKRYLVHYMGWGPRHDEWKSSADVLRVTEENRKKQQELKKLSADSKRSTSKDHVASRSKGASRGGEYTETSDMSSGRPDSPDSVRSEVSTSSSKAAGSSEVRQKSMSSSRTPSRSKENPDDKVSKKRSRKDDVNSETNSSPEPKRAHVASKDKTGTPVSEQEEEASRKGSDVTSSPEGMSKVKDPMSIEMPKSLKAVLIDDYDYVVRQKMLVDIASPKYVTVADIIEDFVSQTSDESAQQVAYGVKDLFDVVLGSNLLYKFERPQYDQIIKEDSHKHMSTVYGAEHFLRFFLKINEFMEESKLSKNYVSTIVPHLRSMVFYLKDNVDKYFDPKRRYVASAADYLRKSIADYDQ